MLSKEEFDFIEKNINEDPASLALKTHGMFPHSMGFLLTQIKQKQRTKKKLPTWSANPKLLFPTDLSAEQCSSELTATYKASLFSGKTCLDLTGGLGIDSLAFSAVFEHVTYVESNPDFISIATHNFSVLEKTNLDILSGDGLEIVRNLTKVVDLIYIDPDRRHSDSRVYSFENSLPNVLENLDLLLEKGKQVLIKASPMMDITLGKNQLKFVSKIWVVSHKNECKEILFLLETNAKSVEISAIELENAHSYSINFEERFTSKKDKSTPKKYLYDPFVAFRKAELSEYIESKFETEPTTALSISTSDYLIEDFPGRCFELEEVLIPNAKTFKKLGIKRANIISRGSNVDANTLHSQLKLDRGGDIFLIALVSGNKSLQLAKCRKLF